MPSRIPVTSKNAPAPLPVYSQAIKYENTVFLSGQVGLEPTTNKLVEGDITLRARQIFKNLTAVLEEAGSSINEVLKVNVFLTDIDNFSKINEIYMEYFGDIKPARTCVAVHQLPLGTDIEIELTAALI